MVKRRPNLGKVWVPNHVLDIWDTMEFQFLKWKSICVKALIWVHDQILKCTTKCLSQDEKNWILPSGNTLQLGLMAHDKGHVS